MIKYESIYAVNTAKMRLLDDKRNRYHWMDGTTRDTDRMTVFTLEQQAEQDSEHNLQFLLELGRKHHQSILVFTDIKIQLLGEYHSVPVMDNLVTESWVKSFSSFNNYKNLNVSRPRREASNQGELVTLSMWKRCFTVPALQGVYDVESGGKIKDRRVVIQRMWDLGFAAQRGRPMTVANIHTVGERSELEDITAMAEHCRHRVEISAAAKKMVNNFTSLNKIAAWPGYW